MFIFCHFTVNQMNYDEDVIKPAKHLLQKLISLPFNKWPMVKDVENVFMTVEAISLFIIYHYDKRNFNVIHKIPLHWIVQVLSVHPMFVNIIQCGFNLEEFTNYVSQLIESIDNSFGENNILFKELKKLLLTEISNDMNTSGNSGNNNNTNGKSEMSNNGNVNGNGTSSLHQTHYLADLDFKYSPTTTGLTKEELIEKAKEISNNAPFMFIFINISHNLSNTDSIVVYRDIPKLREKILNQSNISLIDPFIIPKENIPNSSNVFSFFDSNFQEISGELPHLGSNGIYFVVINYGDVKHHYTIAGHFDSYEEADNYIKGKVRPIIDVNILDEYLKTSYYTNQANGASNTIDNVNDIHELKQEYSQLSSIIKDSMSQDIEQLINNVMSKISSINIIHKREYPYFRAYLQGLKKLELINLQTVIDYITAYIYPYLLTDSADL